MSNGYCKYAHGLIPLAEFDVLVGWMVAARQAAVQYREDFQVVTGAIVTTLYVCPAISGTVEQAAL